MRSIQRSLLLALAIGIGTWTLGWWAVPLVGAAWGLLQRGAARRGREAALAAALAWAALLALDAGAGALLRVAAVLGGIFQMPGAVLLVVTVAFAAALAGTAAYVLGARVR